MQPRQRQNAEIVAETVISTIVSIIAILGTLFRIVWILVMALYRSVDQLNAVDQHRKLITHLHFV
jgi:hypothetical protein